MISMTPRKDISLQRAVLTPVFSVLLTLCVGAGIFAVLGYEPSAALYQFFVAPLSRPDQMADLFVKACPLIIIATGLAFCYRAKVWNIGAEGQIVMGAVCAGGVALFFPAMPDLLMMPAMIIAAMAGGMALAFIPGILKTRFNTNEILVSLMLR
jgi:simple sugar transport system permease protein